MQWQLPYLANDYCLAVIGQTIIDSEVRCIYKTYAPKSVADSSQ